MNLRFTNWYTQALGATLGIVACIYSYLNGYMITYSNIATYFDSLWFGGIVSSYFLLPLCILTLLLAIIKSYDPDKIFFNIPLENFNVGIIVSTVIIGFMGARIYFTIPAIFILFNLININIADEKIIIENEDTKYEEIKKSKEITNLYDDFFIDENTIVFQNINDLNLKSKHNCSDIKLKENSDEKEIKTLLTKRSMAKELLAKNAQKQFIMDITGLTLKELKILESEFEK